MLNGASPERRLLYQIGGEERAHRNADHMVDALLARRRAEIEAQSNAGRPLTSAGVDQRRALANSHS